MIYYIYLLKIIAILKIDVEVDFSVVLLMTTNKALQNLLKTHRQISVRSLNVLKNLSDFPFKNQN